MIVAGEASGDAHAARLVREMQSSGSFDFEFFGAVSHDLRAAGVEEIVDADHLSVVGLFEIARVLPMFWRAFRKLRDAAVKRRADAVILVDFPEFNLKLARSLSRRGIRVIYYISPQIWAWRTYRLRAVRRYVDLLLTILPFEETWYRERGFSKVEYVGNPTIHEIAAESSREEFCGRHGLDPDRPVISLLPGSRHKEIVRILPPMLQAAAEMSAKRPELQFVIVLAASRSDDEVTEAFVRSGTARGAVNVTVVKGETHDALNASDAAAVTSGTATLETAVIGTPLAIVYKTSPLNYKLFRPLISVEHFGLINLIAGERIAAEMIQDDFTPSGLARELARLLEPDTNAAFRRKLAEATRKLGSEGASKRAAQAIIGFLGRADENRRGNT